MDFFYFIKNVLDFFYFIKNVLDFFYFIKNVLDFCYFIKNVLDFLLFHKKRQPALEPTQKFGSGPKQIPVDLGSGRLRLRNTGFATVRAFLKAEGIMKKEISSGSSTPNFICAFLNKNSEGKNNLKVRHSNNVS